MTSLAKKFVSRLRTFEPAYLLYLAALLALAPLLHLQLRSLAVPILGEHNWRQADTYAVAYNFVHESADFFHPRIDWANNRSGIMGMEAPIYPYLSFLAMTVFGDAARVARTVAWFMGALAALFFARYLRPAGRLSVAAGALLMFFCSPLGLLEFRQIQPDGPLAALMMMAAACLHQFARSERRGWFAAGLGLYSLAALTKLPALAAGPAMWLFTWTAKPTPLRKIVARGAWFAAPLLAAVAWHAWARHLNQAFNDGDTYFAIDFDLKSMLADATHGGQLRHLFGALASAYVSNWVFFPAVLVGFALGFEAENRALALPMAAWFAGAGLLLAAFSSRLSTHWYYAIVIFPPVVYFGALGLGRLIDLSGDGQPPSSLSCWAGLVLIPALALAPLVGGDRRQLADVPGSAAFPQNSTWIGELPLAGLLALFAIGYCALQLRPFPHRPRFWLVAVLIAGALGLSRAGRDATESFKWRARERDWGTAPTELADLRRFVGRYSTRNARFVVDGANPWYLYLPLRKGWSVARRSIERNGLEWYAERGAQFLIHYPETGRKPRGLKSEQLLGKRPNWELYCLRKEGCRPLPSRRDPPESI